MHHIEAPHGLDVSGRGLLTFIEINLHLNHEHRSVQSQDQMQFQMHLVDRLAEIKIDRLAHIQN